MNNRRSAIIHTRNIWTTTSMTLRQLQSVCSGDKHQQRPEQLNKTWVEFKTFARRRIHAQRVLSGLGMANSKCIEHRNKSRPINCDVLLWSALARVCVRITLALASSETKAFNDIWMYARNLMKGLCTYRKSGFGEWCKRVRNSQNDKITLRWNEFFPSLLYSLSRCGRRCVVCHNCYCIIYIFLVNTMLVLVCIHRIVATRLHNLYV